MYQKKMLPRFTVNLKQAEFEQLLSANKKYLMVKNHIKFKVPGLLVVSEISNENDIATGRIERYVIVGVEPLTDVLLHEFVLVHLTPEIQLI